MSHADYQSSAGRAVTAWNAPSDGNLSLIQTFIYTSPTGPRPSQNVPHPHDAILDPTGNYIVVPDLGSDILRIYAFDHDTNHLTEIQHVETATGSGPRHGVFWTPSGKCALGDPLFFYVLSELDNTVTSFRVNYTLSGGIASEKVDVVSSFGTALTVLHEVAAEIKVSMSCTYDPS